MIPFPAQKRNYFDYRTSKYLDLRHLLREDSTAAIYFYSLPPHIRTQVTAQATSIHSLQILRQCAEALPVSALSTTVLPNMAACRCPRQNRDPLL